jgi:hypothetical protein
VVAERGAQQGQLLKTRRIESAGAQRCHDPARFKGDIVQMDLMKPAGLDGNK